MDASLRPQHLTSVAAGAGLDAVALLDGLRHAIDVQFDEVGSAVGNHQRDAALQGLLNSTELLWKAEEQVMFPALQSALPELANSLRSASRELTLLRELAAQARRTMQGDTAVSGIGLAGAGVDSFGPEHHADHAVVGTLEGLSMLHFERVDELVQRGTAVVNWTGLKLRVQKLIEQN